MASPTNIPPPTSQPPFSIVAAPTTASANPPPPEYDASGKHCSFPLFPKLATELRIKIWRFALPDPQTIEIAYEVPSDKLETSEETGTTSSGSNAAEKPSLSFFNTSSDALVTTESSSSTPTPAEAITSQPVDTYHFPYTRKGNWRVTNGMPSIAILQVCQEARTETKDVIDNYIMLRMDADHTRLFWFNPAMDTIVFNLATYKGKQKIVLGAGFPLGNSIKRLMTTSIIRHHNEIRYNNNRLDPEPLATLPETFNCEMDFSTENLVDAEGWSGTMFYYHRRKGNAPIFKISAREAVYDLITSSFRLSETAMHVVHSAFIEVGKTIRPETEDMESKLVVIGQTIWRDDLNG